MGFFRFRIPSLRDLLRHLLLSWLIGALLEYLLIPGTYKALGDIQVIALMSFPRLLLVTLLCTAALCIGTCFFDYAKYERYAIAGVYLLLTVVSQIYNRQARFFVISFLLLDVLAVYAILGSKGTDPVPKPVLKSHWAFPTVLAVLALGMGAVLCLWSVCRYLIFSTPCFDFGIFAQMFHNMRTTGLPMTTVERDGLLSHFAVHVSPIYYLMLPIYWLFPDPATLQILQVIVLCSSVIPLWLIGKHHGLSGLQRLLLCTLLLILPAVGGGVYYDLHENCFLLPLILWLMYAMDKRSCLLVGIFAFLTLMVKEDAAVYVAVAALYLIFRTGLNYHPNYRREHRKDLITGIAVLVAASVYFLLVTNYLATKGTGVMTVRYKNFMLDADSSLFSVIIAVLLCPMKMLYECVDPEKLSYIFQTLLPLLGLPLLTRKFERYLLLIPYILLNLMSDYPYQHDILFQYNFGSTAFLLYLTAVNLSDLHLPQARLVPTAVAITVALGVFCRTVAPVAYNTVTSHVQNKAYYHDIREELDKIPENVSVTSGTFYVAYLSQRSLLYDIRYATREHTFSTEYIVVNSGSSGDFAKYGKSFEVFDAAAKKHGYQVINDHEKVVIYCKAPN